MRIIMPSFEPLEWMPPTINLLKKLDALGYEVLFVTVYPCEYLKTLDLKNVKNKCLYSKEINVVKKIKYMRGVSGVLYRFDIAIKKIIARRLKGVLNAEMRKDDYLWVVNEMTVMLGGKSFLKKRHYGFLIYELHERKFYARHIEYAAKHADFVVVPEYCRAHIMQSRYSLKQVPIVLPNKSDIDFEGMMLSEKGQKAVGKIHELHAKGNKVLIYMGGIGPERPLEALLSAIKETKNCKLVVLGGSSGYLQKLLDDYSDVLIYLGRFNPPEHLAVARFADVGVLNYVSINQTQGLNALFCAPNKIFEYTGLGLPVIANDIPGLRFSVLSSGCGELVDYQDTKSVLKAVNAIFDNYSVYSEAAKKYYDSVDIDSIVHEIVNNINKKTKS